MKWLYFIKDLHSIVCLCIINKLEQTLNKKKEFVVLAVVYICAGFIKRKGCCAFVTPNDTHILLSGDIVSAV